MTTIFWIIAIAIWGSIIVFGLGSVVIGLINRRKNKGSGDSMTGIELAMQKDREAAEKAEKNED